MFVSFVNCEVCAFLVKFRVQLEHCWYPQNVCALFRIIFLHTGMVHCLRSAKKYTNKICRDNVSHVSTINPYTTEAPHKPGSYIHVATLNAHQF